MKRLNQRSRICTSKKLLGDELRSTKLGRVKNVLAEVVAAVTVEVAVVIPGADAEISIK
jgi:hypothetical protein